jgi:hypothetical protein
MFHGCSTNVKKTVLWARFTRKKEMKILWFLRRYTALKISKNGCFVPFYPRKHLENILQLFLIPSNCLLFRFMIKPFSVQWLDFSQIPCMWSLRFPSESHPPIGCADRRGWPRRRSARGLGTGKQFNGNAQ